MQVMEALKIMNFKKKKELGNYVKYNNWFSDIKG